MAEQKKTFVYLLLDDMEITMKALTEYQQRVQVQMEQVPAFGDEWTRLQGELVKSRNTLQIFNALETRHLGAWTLTFEPGKEGIDQAHKTMTGQPLYDRRMPDVPLDEFIGHSPGEWNH